MIFPHHENEIAQSESRNGKLMAKTWMQCRNGIVDGEKMSSVGNVRQVADMLDKQSQRDGCSVLGRIIQNPWIILKRH